MTTNERPLEAKEIERSSRQMQLDSLLLGKSSSSTVSGTDSVSLQVIVYDQETFCLNRADRHTIGQSSKSELSSSESSFPYITPRRMRDD